VFTHRESDWAAPYRLLRNGNFMREAGYHRQLAQLYGKRSFRR
jgi:hypothetical protein